MSRSELEIKKLFSKVYWYDEKCWQTDKIIVANRIDFAIKYEIEKNCRALLPINLKRDMFDHAEFYKTKKGYIYLVSPYGNHDNLAREYGFIRCPILYHEKASSYIKEFKNKIEYNRFINQKGQKC